MNNQLKEMFVIKCFCKVCDRDAYVLYIILDIL